MARITVEDCLENLNNRFELVMLAAKRARQLMRGSADPTVPWDNDKATVVALREIANGHTDFSDAHEIDMMPTMQQTTLREVEEHLTEENPVEEHHPEEHHSSSEEHPEEDHSAESE